VAAQAGSMRSLSRHRRPPRLVLGALLAFGPVLLAAAPGEPAEPAAPGASTSPGVTQLPAGVLLIKGAWSSASDFTTPVPEGGTLSGHRYRNPYFDLEIPLPDDWTETFEGPPPSDTGAYVLEQLAPADTSRDANRATVQITAQDMFFSPVPARNALELIRYAGKQLQDGYTVEQAPEEVQIAGRPFVRVEYTSSATGLSWYVLATQLRCHTVQLVVTSRDRRFIEHLIGTMSRMSMSASAGESDVPVCIAGYAEGDNVLSRVEPVFTVRRFNPIPVRLIIDASGQVKHIHFISAFPDQARSITDALMQWRFRPYSSNGHSLAVETGLLFGAVPSGGQGGRQ
jgi:hypothetical protein